MVLRIHLTRSRRLDPIESQFRNTDQIWDEGLFEVEVFVPHILHLSFLNLVHSLAKPASQKPDNQREYKVGDRVTVSLSGGRIVDATVTAVVNKTEGVRLQVACGRDETALVYLWQVHPSNFGEVHVKLIVIDLNRRKQ